MKPSEIINRLEQDPIIAAIRDDGWDAALVSPVPVLFYLSANLLTVRERIAHAHQQGKVVFIHMDLAEGLGKDRTAVRFLAQAGVDGIISTKASLIRLAKEQSLLTVQRFFALDSKGMDSIDEMIRSACPHLVEIMPGVISKAIRRFSSSRIPVIAGGLVTTKEEVTDILKNGAIAVSTGQNELWYI